MHFKTDSDNSVPILDVSSKQIYQSFLEKKQIPPSAKTKLADKFPDTIVDWEMVYSLAFCSSLESKIREYVLSVLSAKRKQNPSSIYSSPAENRLNFGNVLSWLRDNGILIDTLKETDLIFGKLCS